MTSNGKIEESQRRLDKIKASEHHKDRTDLTDNIRSFLTSTNSIFDHLLEEYNKKFNLKISLQKDLYPRTFKEAAEKQKNVDALKFITDFSAKKKIIESYPILGALIKRRDQDIHRESQQPNKIVISVGGNTKPEDEFAINFDDLPRNIDDTCQQLLDAMRNFVSEMKRDYP